MVRWLLDQEKNLTGNQHKINLNASAKTRLSTSLKKKI